MKLAAIDLGSNSVHLVIVDVSSSGSFSVIGREKQMVRLGERTLARGRLTAAAMKRGVAALLEFKRLADNHGVEEILAVATSAIREAGNGDAFLARVGRETGIWPRVVSGDVEARLIYLAALHSVHLEGRHALVIDIGGGSVELALGSGSALSYTASEKLGVLRMAERFVTTDPLGERDERRLAEHVRETMEQHCSRIRRLGFDTAIGTSGTILALGALAQRLHDGTEPESMHHVTVRADAVHELRRRLVRMPLRARHRLPGLDESRADIILPGVVILDTLLERLGVRQLLLSDWALREGLLVDYIQRHPRTLERAEAYPDVRQRSVVRLAEHCRYDEAHARQVARLALALFDGTVRLHGLGEAERALLEHAATLHDVGHHISYPSHHKHSHYLIRHGDLRGFSPQEIDVMANVARFHRRAAPRKRHADYAVLPRPVRRVVRVLSALLRVAEGLDRGHRQAVREVTTVARHGRLRVQVHAEGDCELEVMAAQRRAVLLADVLGLPVRVQAVAIPAEVVPLRRVLAVSP